MKVSSCKIINAQYQFKYRNVPLIMFLQTKISGYFVMVVVRHLNEPTVFFYQISTFQNINKLNLLENLISCTLNKKKSLKSLRKKVDKR